MERAYKFRLYPTREQAVLMQRTFGCTRFVYNYYLARRKDLYEESKTTLNYVACSADMTLLKKEYTWLKEVDCTALQSSLRALDTAYQNFFRRVKQGGKPGYPHFKKATNQSPEVEALQKGANHHDAYRYENQALQPLRTLPEPTEGEGHRTDQT